MNLQNLPDKIRKRVSGHLFELAHLHSVNFKSAPIISGYWPRIINEGGTIGFGDRCIFWSTRLRHCIIARPGSILQIGQYGFMNDGLHVYVATTIRIGNFVKIGEMVYIYDTDVHSVAPDRPVKQAPVTIGNNVWIGARSIILAGSHIGDHAVIAAGSVVNGMIPARSVAAGIPARVVKTFEAEDNWFRR